MEGVQLENLEEFFFIFLGHLSFNPKSDKTKTDSCCPVLKSCWQGIQDEAQTMFKFHLPFAPKYCNLGLMPLGEKKVKILHICFVVAMKMIACRCPKARPLTRLQWQEGLKNVCLVEKMTAELHLTVDIVTDFIDIITGHLHLIYFYFYLPLIFEVWHSSVALHLQISVRQKTVFECITCRNSICSYCILL